MRPRSDSGQREPGRPTEKNPPPSPSPPHATPTNRDQASGGKTRSLRRRRKVRPFALARAAYQRRALRLVRKRPWLSEHMIWRRVLACPHSPRWDSFEVFLADLTPRLEPGLLLELKDPAGIWEKGNVRWGKYPTRLNDEAVKVIRFLGGRRGEIKKKLATLYWLKVHDVCRIVRAGVKP